MNSSSINLFKRNLLTFPKKKGVKIALNDIAAREDQREFFDVKNTQNLLRNLASPRMWNEPARLLCWKNTPQFSFSIHSRVYQIHLNWGRSNGIIIPTSRCHVNAMAIRAEGVTSPEFRPIYISQALASFITIPFFAFLDYFLLPIIQSTLNYIKINILPMHTIEIFFRSLFTKHIYGFILY